MVMVIHFSGNKDPDIYTGLDERDEKKVLKALEKDWKIQRAPESEWFGQDNPKYMVHHWNATRRV